MRWQIAWQPGAAREFDNLGAQVQNRIDATLTDLAMGEPMAVSRVESGPRGEVRLRVGKWRIRLVLDHANHTIYVEHVGLRNHVYD